MKKYYYLCGYCLQRRPYKINDHVPCKYCIQLLKKALHEEEVYNEFTCYGQIFKVPIKGGFSQALVMGEAKYIIHYMKRLCKKAAAFRG